MLTWAEPGGPEKGPRVGWQKVGVCLLHGGEGQGLRSQGI